MPTEKDVKYYESLVMREVSCKDLSFGCSVLVENIWIWTIYWGCLSDWGGMMIYNILYDNNTWIACESVIRKVIWHEIRPHHILLRCEKTNVFCRFIQSSTVSSWDATSLYIVTQHSEYNIDRDLTKPFSWQSDDTKIELGKIVEKVLFSNQEK